MFAGRRRGRGRGLPRRCRGRGGGGGGGGHGRLRRHRLLCRRHHRFRALAGAAGHRVDRAALQASPPPYNPAAPSGAAAAAAEQADEHGDGQRERSGVAAEVLEEGVRGRVTLARAIPPLRRGFLPGTGPAIVVDLSVGSAAHHLAGLLDGLAAPGGAGRPFGRPVSEGQPLEVQRPGADAGGDVDVRERELSDLAVPDVLHPHVAARVADAVHHIDMLVLGPGGDLKAQEPSASHEGEGPRQRVL
mmetsp:Transcript_55484/g.179952  ORF Transcript_55484/g.179952 Transcript_55484/m.179952 type:complete len:246 (-) Transcript_55484:1932-2669(-)